MPSLNRPPSDSLIILCAALGVVVVEVTALLNGINGVALSASIGVLGALGGVKLRDLTSKK